MPLLVSNQCIRAICFDRLTEMFDSEVPFPRPKRKLDGIFALCHTSLSNWQSHCKQGGKKSILCHPLLKLHCYETGSLFAL